MIEEDFYWLSNNNIIIIKPEIESLELVDKKILNNSSGLIFSNFFYPEISMKLYYIYDAKYENFYSGSKFNKNLENIFIKENNIEIIKFGDEFNSSLNNDLDNLTKLKELFLGFKFNQPLKQSLSKLESLENLVFSDKYNQPLDNSLSNLKSLKKIDLGKDFNQPIGDSLKNVSNLEKIRFSLNFSHPLKSTLKTFKKIKILDFSYCKYEHVLDESIIGLDNLEELYLHGTYRHSVDKILNEIISLKKLKLGLKYEHNTIIPKNIKYLYLDCNNQFIIDNLSNELEELEIGNYINLELNNLPNNLRILKFINARTYTNKLNSLPNSIEYLQLDPKYNTKIDNLPNNLKKICCSIDYMYKYNLKIIYPNIEILPWELIDM